MAFLPRRNEEPRIDLVVVLDPFLPRDPESVIRQQLAEVRSID